MEQIELPLEDRGEASRVQWSGEATSAAQGDERSGLDTLQGMERIVEGGNLRRALKRVQQKCAVVAAQLDDAKADAGNVTKQMQIERDLQDLLDTFKQLASSRMTPGGNCNCKGDRNKLLAELKVVRMMQARANEETRSVNDERGAANPANAADALPANVWPMLREKILVVRDVQADARDALKRIHEQLNAPDEAPPEPEDTP